MRLCYVIIIVIFSTVLSIGKKNANLKEKERQLFEFLEEDEGKLLDPYLGGYNSDEV